MTNRKKRLEKGIESLEKQIAFHKEKQKTAQEQREEDLVDYFKKEIDGLTKSKNKKEGILDKN